MIRNAQYKLMVLDNGSERLFDLINDPYEGDNLINSTDVDVQNVYAALKNKAEGIEKLDVLMHLIRP